MTCDQLSDFCYQSYTQARYLDSLVPSWSFSFVFTVITQWKNEKCEVDTVITQWKSEKCEVDTVITQWKSEKCEVDTVITQWKSEKCEVDTRGM